MRRRVGDKDENEWDSYMQFCERTIYHYILRRQGRGAMEGRRRAIDAMDGLRAGAECQMWNERGRVGVDSGQKKGRRE